MKRLHGMMMALNGVFLVLNIYFIWALDKDATIVNYGASAFCLMGLISSMWFYLNGDEQNG